MATAGNVEFVNLTKRYGKDDAVQGVSFSINQGEFLTLLGSSGCGKTTLLRMLAGFETPTSGDILIGGKRMNDVAPFRRPIGMVFQNLALFPHLNVNENIAFGLNVRKVERRQAQKDVDAALELVGLNGYGSRQIGQLSGGQRQRIALARALVLKPQVLLLDEPLSALDMKLRLQMQIELKAIQRQTGTTFVFVTHDQEEALTMSDRIAVMSGGRVEQLDTAKNVYERPGSEFVARFVGETNFMKGRVLSSQAGKCTVHLDAFNGVFMLNSETTFEAGSAIAACVRPEFVVLGDAAKQCDVRIQARIDGKHYSGATHRYDLSVEDKKFIARVPSGPEQHKLEVGSSVEVGLSADKMTLVPLNA